jgi:hypothetical protein
VDLFNFAANTPTSNFDAFGLLAGPPPVIIVKPAPPPVVACTATFCTFYVGGYYIWDTTGVHDWLGNTLSRCFMSDYDECVNDCDRQHDADHEDCGKLPTPYERSKCRREANEKYARCLKDCWMKYGK